MGNQNSSATTADADAVFGFHLIMDRTEAEQALTEAEQQDLYLEECNDDPNNRRARQRMIYAPNHIAYHEWASVVQQLIDAPTQFPLRLQQELGPIRIIGLMPSADGGMPHTRPGRLICVPRLEHLNTVTLLHETWHVHQREYASWWTHVFREWGWEEIHDGYHPLPTSLETRRRYNPDTLDSPLWVYKNMWIPVPVLTDIAKGMDAEIWFYHVGEHYHRRTLPDELRIAFPRAPIAAFEHPRELAAYLLSEPDSYRTAPGFQQLMELVGHISITPTAAKPS